MCLAGLTNLKLVSDMKRFETQLVYDVHNLHTQEYLRTFSTMEQVMEYCIDKHGHNIGKIELTRVLTFFNADFA